MTSTQGIGSLSGMPQSERVEVLFRLWDQLIDEGWIPTPDAELDAELDRRIENHDANPERTKTWDQVLERIRGKP